MHVARFVFVVAMAVPLVVGCSKAEVRGTGTAAVGATGFPEGYHRWKRINTSPIVLERARQSRDIYANEIALTHREGRPFPPGSVLVKEERIVAQDPSGRLVPRDVFRVSVMFKLGSENGAEKRATWVFKAFDPDTHQEYSRDRVDPDGCYFCHHDAQARDYVFSDIR